MNDPRSDHSVTRPKELSHPEVMPWLDSWAGRGIAIRVTANGNLLAVFHGVLRERSGEKAPATFWPLVHAEPIENADHLERPGVYLHEDGFEGATLHTGNHVLELHQHDVTLNLRRL